MSAAVSAYELVDVISRRCGVPIAEAEDAVTEALEVLAERIDADDALASGVTAALMADDVADAARELVAAIVDVLAKRDAESLWRLLGVVLRLPELGNDVWTAVRDLARDVADVFKRDPVKRARRLRKRARQARYRGNADKAERLSARADAIDG